MCASQPGKREEEKETNKKGKRRKIDRWMTQAKWLTERDGTRIQLPEHANGKANSVHPLSIQQRIPLHKYIGAS